MANLESKFGPTAEKLLAKFGTTITGQRETDDAYDPATGGSPTTPSTLTGLGVQLDFRGREINGTTVQVGDKKLIYRGDELQINDIVGAFRVAGIVRLDPDTSGVIIQTCTLRK